ncbi:hypothetical protein [Arthrobacter sp. Y81]|uniref:hypothetical protein n=1 Tax=Arthrobacter sp. Y81 TaxID=2058897 RepID=UPI002158996F|nr:hypothetical protein [Arthrobacter sp. Y81]
MNTQLPIANALPGEAVPYYMASGEGARYETNRQLVTVIARAADAGGIFSAAYISGGMGAGSPFVSHKVEHKTLYVFDGICTSGSPAKAASSPPVIPWSFPREPRTPTAWPATTRAS